MDDSQMELPVWRPTPLTRPSIKESSVKKQPMSNGEISTAVKENTMSKKIFSSNNGASNCTFFENKFNFTSNKDCTSINEMCVTKEVKPPLHLNATKHFKIIKYHTSEDDESDFDLTCSRKSVNIDYTVHNKVKVNARMNESQCSFEEKYVDAGVQTLETTQNSPKYPECWIPDDIDVWAERVGRQLRSIKNPITRIHVENDIQFILFDAQLKEMTDNPPIFSPSVKKEKPPYTDPVIYPKQNVRDSNEKKEKPKVPGKCEVDKPKSKPFVPKKLTFDEPKESQPSRSRLSLNRNCKKNNQCTKPKFTNPFQD